MSFREVEIGATVTGVETIEDESNTNNNCNSNTDSNTDSNKEGDDDSHSDSGTEVTTRRVLLAIRWQ